MTRQGVWTTREGEGGQDAHLKDRGDSSRTGQDGREIDVDDLDAWPAYSKRMIQPTDRLRLAMNFQAIDHDTTPVDAHTMRE